MNCSESIHVMKRLFSEEWLMVFGPRLCAVNPLFKGIFYGNVLNINELVQLRDCLWYSEANVQEDLNMLAQIEVIWSIEPTWNRFIIQYFLFVCILNKQQYNKTAVGAEIRTSNLRDHRRPHCQFSFAASLSVDLLCLWNKFCLSKKVYTFQPHQKNLQYENKRSNFIWKLCDIALTTFWLFH